MTREEDDLLVIVPFDVQGHLNPLMQLASKLGHHGFSVHFLITDFNYNRMLNASSSSAQQSNINFVVIPDGMPSDDPRTDIETHCRITLEAIVPFAQRYVSQVAEDRKGRVGVVVDALASSVLDLCHSFNLPTVLFWTSMAAHLALMLSRPHLIFSNAIYPDGSLKESGMCDSGIPSLPLLRPEHLFWVAGFTKEQQQTFFSVTNSYLNQMIKTQWVLCNSVAELEEPVTRHLVSKGMQTCHIGPLQITCGEHGKADCALRKKDTSCLDWLDKQSARSVIYVAYGSLAVMSELQVEEFASGLESTGMLFLWVLRDDLVHGQNGLVERMKRKRGEHFCKRGYFVAWCPQMEVLCHPSVFCFITHCGWNSVTDSIAAGKPMLCLPSFGDQFINSEFVVDVWKIGLRLERKGLNGIVKGEDVKGVVEKLRDDEHIKMNVASFQKVVEEAVDVEGSSSTEFLSFVSSMKAKLAQRSM